MTGDDSDLRPFDREFYLNRAVSWLTPKERNLLHSACREQGVSVGVFCAGLFDLDEALEAEFFRSTHGDDGCMPLHQMISTHLGVDPIAKEGS